MRLLRPRNTRTVARASCFAALERHLDRVGQRRGRPVRGLILDVDECIAPHHGAIPARNLRAIDRLLGRGVQIAVFSNARAGTRLDPLLRRGVSVVTRQPDGSPVRPKPEPDGFHAAAQELGRRGVQRGQILMVGDNYLTDGGAIRAGIDFVKVRPVSTPGRRSAGRVVQQLLRGLYDGVARLHDRLRPPHRRALRLQLD